MIRIGCFSMLAAVLIGCGADGKTPARAPEAEAPMPAGRGTKRALVFVDAAVPPPSAKTNTPQDAELSTPRILRKILDRP